jgi:hypothetical protein
MGCMIISFNIQGHFTLDNFLIDDAQVFKSPLFPPYSSVFSFISNPSAPVSARSSANLFACA